MPILSLSGASLLKKNLRRTRKYFDRAEEIHAGAYANQKINFHRPNLISRYTALFKIPLSDYFTASSPDSSFSETEFRFPADKLVFSG